MDPSVAGGTSYFDQHARAGSVVHERVRVTNFGASATRLVVSATDGLTARTTGSVYSNSGASLAGAGRWLRLTGTHLALRARSSTIYRFTVLIPRSTVAGDHLAGLAFQSPAGSLQAGTRLRIRTVSRSVIGVLIRVDGPAHTAFRISGASITPGPAVHRAEVTTDINNTGQLLAKPGLTIVLSEGGRRTRVHTQLDTVLPGSHIALPILWPHDLPRATYSGTITLTAAGISPVVYRFRQRLGTTLRTQPVPPSSAADGGGGHGLEWALIAAAVVIAILILVVALLLIGRRRGNAVETQPADEPSRRRPRPSDPSRPRPR